MITTDELVADPYTDEQIKEYLQSTEMAAKTSNQHIHRPAPNELYLDIDSQQEYDHLMRWLYLLGKFNMRWRVVRDTPSKSNRGEMTLAPTNALKIPIKVPALCKRHVVIDTGRALHPMERMLLQAALGSDRSREILGWLRLQQGEGDPTVLFEKEPQERTWEVRE